MIPVIDYRDSQLQDKIREAYTTVGFAVFTNLTYSYQDRIINRWYDKIRSFFDLKLETKMKYPYEGETNLGYTMWLKENVDPSAPKDMKESFNYNDKRMPDHLWPTQIEGFKEVALETVMIADEVTERILWQFDSILELGNAHTTGLVDYHKENYSTTRVIHYPGYKGPVEKKQMRIGEHTEYGTITLLWQLNDVPGLEVQDLDGNWHPVPYMKNGIVINIGDLLQRWTNDYFKSTKHRVVNSHIDKPRFSMPHFVDPKPGTIVKNLTKQPDKYEPIESLEYLKWRLSKSY